MTLQRSDDSTVYSNDAFKEGEAGAPRLSFAHINVSLKAENGADVPPASFRSLYRSAIS
jgi:hypothetical protein